MDLATLKNGFCDIGLQVGLLWGLFSESAAESVFPQFIPDFAFRFTQVFSSSL